MSLAQLTSWCAKRLGDYSVVADTKPRPFDVPWIVMDCTEAKKTFKWEPLIRIGDILDEIAGPLNGAPTPEISRGSNG
jgi:CDP-paratose 2-epimerase